LRILKLFSTMRKKDRALQRNLLIVCEGSVTEPDYFALLKRMALETGIWEEITIKPKPSSEIEENAITETPHKSSRTKRQLQPAPIDDEEDEIERRYQWRQTPVKFVKEARDGLKDDIFEEAWAAFDRNGHPAHEQAFSLAREPIEGKFVHIAFSSVAFEHWILLHFERNIFAFTKSECKDQNGRYLDCGTGNHASDCMGRRCIAGHLRTKTYIEGSTKKSSEGSQLLFKKLLEPSTRHKAYENASWLRHNVPHDPTQPYLVNPYTNVDYLLKRLLGEEDFSIEWATCGELKTWQSLSILIDVKDNILECTISNQTNGSRLFNGTDIAASFLKNDQRFRCSPQTGSDVVIPGMDSRLFKFSSETKFSDSIFELTISGHRLLVDL
jgi:hypothetical protein